MDYILKNIGSGSLGFEWIHYTIPKKIRDEIFEKSEKVQTPKNFAGWGKYNWQVDYMLHKLCKKGTLDNIPDWSKQFFVNMVRWMPLCDHPFIVNRDLFIFYPYGVYHDLLESFYKVVTSNGYFVKCDGISSQNPMQMRVIVFRPGSESIYLGNRV